MKTVQKVIVGSMLDRGFIDSARQMKAIDEWHYQVKGEMRLWNKKEEFLADIFNSALEKAGYNVAVNVTFVPKDEESFLIDLSDRTAKPYYLLICYDGHYHCINDPVQYSRIVDDLYLSMIEYIFRETPDTESRIEAIRAMMEDGCCDIGDDICLIRSICPEKRITKDMQIVFDEEEALIDSSALRLVDKKDYTEAEWEDAVEEFTREGLTVFSLKGCPR